MSLRTNKRKQGGVLKAETVSWNCALLGNTVTLLQGASRSYYVKATSANVTINVSAGILMLGTEIEVTFEQDAVGGRTITLGGSGGATMVGGGTSAPALGALEKTVYRFRQAPGKICVSKQIA